MILAEVGCLCRQRGEHIPHSMGADSSSQSRSLSPSIVSEGGSARFCGSRCLYTHDRPHLRVTATESSGDSRVYTTLWQRQRRRRRRPVVPHSTRSTRGGQMARRVHYFAHSLPPTPCKVRRTRSGGWIGPNFFEKHSNQVRSWHV